MSLEGFDRCFDMEAHRPMMCFLLRFGILSFQFFPLFFRYPWLLRFFFCSPFCFQVFSSFLFFFLVFVFFFFLGGGASGFFFFFFGPPGLGVRTIPHLLKAKEKTKRTNFQTQTKAQILGCRWETFFKTYFWSLLWFSG